MKRQRELKKLTGIEPSISAVVRVMIEEAPNGATTRRRGKGPPRGERRFSENVAFVLGCAYRILSFLAASVTLTAAEARVQLGGVENWRCHRTRLREKFLASQSHGRGTTDTEASGCTLPRDAAFTSVTGGDAYGCTCVVGRLTIPGDRKRRSSHVVPRARGGTIHFDQPDHVLHALQREARTSNGSGVRGSTRAHQPRTTGDARDSDPTSSPRGSTAQASADRVEGRMKQLSWPPDKDGLAELRRLKDEGNAYASEMLFAAGTGVLASQEAINWYIERSLACERCGNPATRDEGRVACPRYPNCFAIDSR